MVKTAPELQSEARSNHDAAARALRMARGLTRASEIERLERFAAELETRANELEAQAASPLKRQAPTPPARPNECERLPPHAGPRVPLNVRPEP